jgi:hypothetical protein
MRNPQKGSAVIDERGSGEKIWSSCILVEQRQWSQVESEEIQGEGLADSRKTYLDHTCGGRVGRGWQQ